MRLDLLEVGVRVRASPKPSQVCAATCLKLGLVSAIGLVVSTRSSGCTRPLTWGGGGGGG